MPSAFLAQRDKNTFFAAREQGKLLKQKIAEKLADIETQRDELVSQRRELEKQQKELQVELASLRQRKSQIPQKNLNIRDRIAKELNLDKTELPFVGELLKVHDDAAEWEGAIERLLRGFGLRILVCDRNYQEFNSYVCNNNLKGRLVYYRVTQSTSQATQRQASQNTVPAKLEIKPDDRTFFHWLSDKLVQSYNYTCCNLEQFVGQTRAITKTGLIKHGGERHEKDDSSGIGDRRNYILGWDNAAKIAAIEAELDSVNEELNELNKRIKSLEKKRRQRQQQQSWLQDFMNFTDFTEIDWRNTEQEKQKLVRDLEELEVSSDRQINDFRSRLKTCLEYAVEQPNEERFKNIQKLLIIPFKEQDKWTDKVTDVRNWLDFSVSERDRTDNKEKSYYTNSSGLSGGQKAKLAFTILASTISYQFGLNQTNFSGKSFRFVAIDEAFGKVDSPNTRSIMNLFQTLNLQLLVITPSDKIEVLEPYISSLHFVHNKETKDFSSVESVSIDKFQQNRQLALANSNDKSFSN